MLVDFTQPDVVADNLAVALPHNVDCVVGTTGLSNEGSRLASLAPEGTCLFYAPNFTTGAVLMMEFAKAAAPYFPRPRFSSSTIATKKTLRRDGGSNSSNYLGGARRSRKHRSWSGNGNRGRRARAAQHRRRPRSFHQIHGVCRQPGSRVRLDGSNAFDSPRLLGSRFLYARRSSRHQKRRRARGLDCRFGELPRIALRAVTGRAIILPHKISAAHDSLSHSENIPFS